MTLILNKLTQSLNQKQHSIVIFCDLQKAFDTCNHEILLNKLSNIGITGIELHWFRSYLTQRTQFVSIDNTDSTLRQILTGVPQGSILGPLLFILYINDLPQSSDLFSVLFADDTSLYATSDNIDELITFVNQQFHKVCTYFRQNKLSLHPDKTKFLLISHNKTVEEMDVNLVINNNNPNQSPLINLIKIQKISKNDPIPAIKYLGVYFDPELNFKYHIAQISKKLSRALFSIRQVKNILPTKSLIALYYSLFHCHLVYAVEIWGSASPSLLQPLIKKQKMAIRLISGANYNSHTEPLFKKLSILPLTNLITFFNLKLIHSFVYNTIPTAFNNTWLTNREHRLNQPNNEDLALRNDNNLYIPFCHKSNLLRFPLFNLPKIWNSLPAILTSTANPFHFCMQLKNYLNSTLSDTPNCTRLLCPSCHLNL